MRTLIIDDEILVGKTLAKTLRKFGAEPVIVQSVEAALREIGTAPHVFDVIFCDLQMPDRDGVQMLRELTARSVTSGLVLVSGKGRDIVAAAASTARQHGLNVLGSLHKPFEQSDIAALMEAAAQPLRVARHQRAAAAIDAADIRRGLDAGEFAAAFQPKVNPHTRAITGAESLARWTHGVHGAIPPGIFIPIAEETGLIDAVTDAVLASALHGLNALRAQGLDAHVSVNLSTRSMTNLDLPDRLSDTVLRAGLLPSQIMLEVTESQLVKNLADFLEIATRLRLKGFALSIDDFGTGFSSLEQVSRLPVSELKIDRAFVAGTPTNARTREILKASLSLGKSLGLTCVCEGVELEAEWNLVRDLGTDSVQGYYVTRPLSIDAFLGWCAAWDGTWHTPA